MIKILKNKTKLFYNQVRIYIYSKLKNINYNEACNKLILIKKKINEKIFTNMLVNI